MFKAFILYVVIVWQAPPLMIDNQKTILLQFDDGKECLSIANQVAAQMKTEQPPFHFKALRCLPCREFLEDQSRCPPQTKAKSAKPGSK